MPRAVRTLLFSTLYPSSARPVHGIFVETRLRELLKIGGVETRVVAPVPWYYSTDESHGERAAMARTPKRETWHGIDVRHPRYVAIPKVGMTVAPLLLALGARSSVQEVLDEGFDFDLIDAHYFYPDGVAAALLASWFEKPFVVTARGSDLNLIADYRLPRRMVRWSADRAFATICVSRALSLKLKEIGAPVDRIHVVRNGVDSERFRPEPKQQARAHLGLDDGPWILSVGNLLEVKRHDMVIEALLVLRRQLPTVRLACVGHGPGLEGLRALARSSGLEHVVLFAGAVAQEHLRWWYSAADVLALASSREGWPNVLLECMACGTPVVANAVGGVPEMLTDPEVATLVTDMTADTLAAAIGQMLWQVPDRRGPRNHAISKDWAQTSLAQRKLFTEVMESSSQATRCEVPP